MYGYVELSDILFSFVGNWNGKIIGKENIIEKRRIKGI